MKFHFRAKTSHLCLCRRTLLRFSCKHNIFGPTQMTFLERKRKIKEENSFSAKNEKKAQNDQLTHFRRRKRISVGCQFDGLIWVTLTAQILRQIYATGLFTIYERDRQTARRTDTLGDSKDRAYSWRHSVKTYKIVHRFSSNSARNHSSECWSMYVKTIHFTWRVYAHYLACYLTISNKNSAIADKPARRVYRSVKVTKHSTIPYVRYSFLLCNSNFVLRYSPSKMPWPWKPG